MKKKLCIMIITVFLMILMVGLVSTGLKKEKKIQTITTEQKIQSGKIYEITDNSYVEGLEHEFTKEELKMWNEVYMKEKFENSEGVLEEKNIKYMIFLYDENGNEVGQYILDKDGILYDGKQEGKAVYNQKIIQLLRKITK